MKRLVATIVVLSSAPLYFLKTPVASASEVVTVCKPVTTTNVVRDAAAHAGAYQDGFGEGRLSASRGETYKPRSVGGEFARGFDDGYYGRSFTGQEYAIRDRVQSYTTQQCQNVQKNNSNVNPQVIQIYQTPPHRTQQVIPLHQTPPHRTQQVIPLHQTPIYGTQQVIPVDQTPIYGTQQVIPVDQTPIYGTQQVIPVYQTPPNVIPY
jgi:hypothetical protein